MQNTKKHIIVYGGTGYYGRKVVEKLLQKKQQVTVVTRDAEKAKKLFGNEVHVFVGDVTEKNTIVNSLKNVDAIVICLAAMSNKLIRKMKQIERDAVITIMEEAEKANISRLVYMSGYEIREQLLKDLHILEFGEIKLEIEKRITQSTFNWTILGDAPSYEIFFAFCRKGKMTVPGGGFKAIPSVSAEDVGEITAQTVLRNDLNGKRFKLTGPEAFTFPEAAKKISLISGKAIQHMTIPLVIINIVSFIALPFFPFFRYLYKSLKMLNHFPEDLAQDVPNAHQLLKETFNYEPVSLEMEINRRIKEKKLQL